MKKAVLLIHGMGNHTPPTSTEQGGFGQEFTQATSEMLQRFSKHTGDSFATFVDVHEFNYDGWFDKMRTKMADQATSMKDRLAAVSQIYGASIPLDWASTLTNFESKFGGDTFFYTHWLDVLFYGTLLGAKARVDAAIKINELVATYGASNVHIIAHSLGTALLHDTLHLLYRPEHDPNDEIPDLNVINHKLGSVWMVANVSRLVNSVTGLSSPLATTVRPGEGGCAFDFINIRHELDPFTWLSRFDPRNDGGWISETVFNLNYRNIVTQLVLDPNTHSFTQYVQDPAVVERLFPLILGTKFKTSANEFKKITTEYVSGSLNGAYAALEDELKEALQQPKEISGWADFLKAAKAFKEAVDDINQKFKAI